MTCFPSVSLSVDFISALPIVDYSVSLIHPHDDMAKQEKY